MRNRIVPSLFGILGLLGCAQVEGPAGPKAYAVEPLVDGGRPEARDASGEDPVTPEDDGGAADAAFDTARLKAYFTSACSGCHDPRRPAGGLVLTPDTFFDNTRGIPSRQVPRLALIEPGDADASYLFLKLGGPDVEAGLASLPECVESPVACGVSMPKRGPGYPTPAWMAELRAYIEAGAPRF